MHSIFDRTRAQFLRVAFVTWVVLAILYALIYFPANVFFGTGNGRWDTYELIVAVLSLPYIATILLVNIFCVFRGEKGYDSR
jgi:hypothetical protein